MAVAASTLDPLAHCIWPIWTGGEVRFWCSQCASFTCGVPRSTLPRLGKVYRARLRQLSAGVVGDYVIALPGGGFVARRCRLFYRRDREPSPWPPVDSQLCGSSEAQLGPRGGARVPPQYLRERRMYSVNSASTMQLLDAKRWKSRQAAHKANSKLFGRVVRASTLDPQGTLF
jgi:hypothetical protein